MPRPINPQPKQDTPQEQGLGIPVNRPEGLQDNAPHLNREIAEIRQAIGGLEEAVKTLKTELASSKEDIKPLQTFHDRVSWAWKIIGGLLIGFVTLLWWLVGAEITILRKMAADQIYKEAHPEKLEEKVQDKKLPKG